MLWNYFDYIVTGYIYIAMSLSRSSTLSINVLLIFEMNYLNRALFLYALSFSALPFSFAAAAAAAAKRSIVFFTAIFASLQPHNSDLTLKF